jgi:hypothetical protein
MRMTLAAEPVSGHGLAHAEDEPMGDDGSTLIGSFTRSDERPRRVNMNVKVERK